MDPVRQASHRRFDICDREAVGALRRCVGEQAMWLGATPSACARAQLVATELATNLIQHASPGGWVLTRPLPPAALELIAADRGPGIADPAAATAGRSAAPRGLGRGLAAARRASALFDLHSQPGGGTIVLAVADITADGGWRCGEPRRWGGISVGITEPCGDAWAVAPREHGCAVAVIDGLGHGSAASAAADAAAAGFAAALGDPGKFLATANVAMQGTRGAAATACQFQASEGMLRYVAVGNVNGCIATGTVRRRLVTYNGTLGLGALPPRAPVLTLPCPEGSTLIVWTDGLHSRTAAGGLTAELLTHDPAVIAAALYRDHHRGGDDATVVVVRNEKP